MKTRFALPALALCTACATQAAPVTFMTSLSGPAESPPNASPATGGGTVVFDLSAHSLTVSESFANLTSGTTASHIHCCTTVPGTGTAGVATMVPTFSLLPLGVTSGSFTQSFDTSLASTYNPAFVTLLGSVSAAETALFNGLVAGEAYLNIHTVNFSSGEIRGFLAAAAPVPEPEMYALLLAGFGALGFTVRRRRRLATIVR